MAAGLRGGLGLLSWIFLGGALVMMFFVILSGVTDTTPLNKTYFLQADTSSISGARAISQWTYFYICGAGNQNCGTATAALPFGYAWVGQSLTNVPAELAGSSGDGTTSSYYFYMWRFGWVFYLMALFFASMAVLTGLLSFTRIASGLSSLLAFSATFFLTIAAVLMTVTFVKARDAFRNNGMDASIGTYAFGFTWAAVVCLFLATVLFAGGCFVGRGKKNRDSKVVTDGDAVEDRQTSFFRRNRSTRSRGSFVDNESQRRVVKEEY